MNIEQNNIYIYGEPRISFSNIRKTLLKKSKPCHGCCKMTKGSYPQRMIVYSNVKDGQIVFHKLPVNEERQKVLVHAVSKGKKILRNQNILRYI